jgi:HK97 gp10 family phage protein
MSFGFDFAVEGGDALESLELALKKLPLHLTPSVHIAALKKAAKPLRDRIDATAPEKTGEFLKTLAVRNTKFRKLNEHQVIVGFRKGNDGDKPLKGFIAHFHEFGTSKMQATPFMRPAEQYTKQEQERIYYEEIQKLVDKHLKPYA